MELNVRDRAILQEDFNKIWERAKNPVRAVDAQGDMCLYRSPDGNKCFFGELIPDDLYDPSMESKFANILLTENPNRFFADRYEMLHIYRAIQSIHDWINPEDWHSRLTFIANEYGLTVPE
jgi:hypothetical protein